MIVHSSVTFAFRFSYEGRDTSNIASASSQQKWRINYLVKAFVLKKVMCLAGPVLTLAIQLPLF